MSKEQVAFLTGTQVANRVTLLEQGSPCGQWFRHTAQTINTVSPNPSSVSINWSGNTSWTDTTYISQNVPSGANFTVNKRGVYNLGLQIQYGALGSATFTDRSFRVSIGLIRGGTTISLTQNNYDFADNTPNNPAVYCSAMYELQVGDQLFFQTSQYLSGGFFNVLGHGTAPADFDLNTFWTWELVKPLL